MIYLLPHIIESAAERFAEKEAFRFRDQSLTYGVLVQKANQLANVLHAQGVRRGDRVGVFLSKSLETAIAVYGIMQAGAAYVPLDPKMPAARLGLILRDCDIHHLISEPKQRQSLAQVELRTVIGPDSDSDLPFRQIPWSESTTPRRLCSARDDGAGHGLFDVHLRLDWRTEGHDPHPF
ncbi:MAG: amino acid adenylation domain-containing protein [Caldilineaceae bacterium]|nr:amino acid adenylation domain-containing protein [Caldilineaceae bacterium]